MSIQLGDHTRALLAQSLPLMERSKGRLIEGLGAYVGAVVAGTNDDPELVATTLTEMMLAQSAQMLQSGTFPNTGDLKRQHEALGIEGRHYSRFGDALSPVIRDVLGPNVPSAVPAAWGDAFWAIVRTIKSAGAKAYA
jgi:hemoglobin-like flavoprotein